jgi:hypothetical protein
MQVRDLTGFAGNVSNFNPKSFSPASKSHLNLRQTNTNCDAGKQLAAAANWCAFTEKIDLDQYLIAPGCQ